MSPPFVVRTEDPMDWTKVVVIGLSLAAAVALVALDQNELASMVAGGAMGWLAQPKVKNVP